jgi:hypothetical protein
LLKHLVYAIIIAILVRNTYILSIIINIIKLYIIKEDIVYNVISEMPVQPSKYSSGSGPGPGPGPRPGPGTTSRQSTPLEPYRNNGQKTGRGSQ